MTATLAGTRTPTGTQEWAASNVNIQDGCEHDCRYCPHDPEAIRRGEALMAVQSDNDIRALYSRYRKDPIIKWKDSIKSVVGLDRPASAGLDI